MTASTLERLAAFEAVALEAPTMILSIAGASNAKPAWTSWPDALDDGRAAIGAESQSLIGKEVEVVVIVRHLGPPPHSTGRLSPAANEAPPALDR
jgi:hypothetical protein